jgi:hypothetical protein
MHIEAVPHQSRSTSACANCASVLTGPFCARCGQSAESLERPAWEFVEHALEAFFHFDTRGAKSVLLLFKPGEMTAQYLAGKRARFVPPIRLYILVSLFFFLAIWATNTAIVQFYGTGTPAENAAGEGRLGIRLLAPLDEHLGADASKVAEAVRIDVGQGEALPSWLPRVMARLERGVADPARLSERLSDLFPKAMFALVPLFGLLLGLLYLGRKRFLTEHLVFALHFHTFAFILLTVLIGIGSVLPGGFAGWMFFLPAAAYLLVAMRRVYGGGWIGTAAREFVLLLLYGLLFFFSMLVLLGTSLSEI